MAGPVSVPRSLGLKLMCPCVCQDGGTEDRQAHTHWTLRADDKSYVSELLDRRWVYIPEGQSQLVIRPVLISSTALV